MIFCTEVRFIHLEYRLNPRWFCRVKKLEVEKYIKIIMYEIIYVFIEAKILFFLRYYAGTDVLFEIKLRVVHLYLYQIHSLFFCCLLEEFLAFLP